MSLLRESRRRIRASGHVTFRTWTLAVLLVFGVWLCIAPFVLEYRSAEGPSRAVVNDTVVGLAVVGLALTGLCRPTH
jgi:SPW repeat-containing protein